MPVLLRSVLALIIGIVVGSVVNMGIILFGPLVVPPPAGVDMTTAEGLQAGMHLLRPQHFVAPFLAHAVGTLVGAFIAAFIAIAHRQVVAYAVGCLFLAGGIAASRMIPAPTWFIALDLVVAYIPMAWLGHRMALAIAPQPALPSAHQSASATR
jgi:hypothetical protein